MNAGQLYQCSPWYTFGMLAPYANSLVQKWGRAKRFDVVTDPTQATPSLGLGRTLYTWMYHIHIEYSRCVKGLHKHVYDAIFHTYLDPLKSMTGRSPDD